MTIAENDTTRALHTTLKRLQTLSGPTDPGWKGAWTALIRGVESQKAAALDEGVDVEAKVQEHLDALFGPRIERTKEPK